MDIEVKCPKVQTAVGCIRVKDLFHGKFSKLNTTHLEFVTKILRVEMTLGYLTFRVRVLKILFLLQVDKYWWIVVRHIEYLQVSALKIYCNRFFANSVRFLIMLI